MFQADGAVVEGVVVSLAEDAANVRVNDTDDVTVSPLSSILPIDDVSFLTSLTTHEITSLTRSIFNCTVSLLSWKTSSENGVFERTQFILLKIICAVLQQRPDVGCVIMQESPAVLELVSSSAIRVISPGPYSSLGQVAAAYVQLLINGFTSQTASAFHTSETVLHDNDAVVDDDGDQGAAAVENIHLSELPTSDPPLISLPHPDWMAGRTQDVTSSCNLVVLDDLAASAVCVHNKLMASASSDYCGATSSQCVSNGVWYFEVCVVRGSHFRIGFIPQNAEVQNNIGSGDNQIAWCGFFFMCSSLAG